jgi:hypothetical protein
MLIRDQLGYWRNVPDTTLYGVQHVGYDGLGNPVGCPLLAALAPLASSVLPAIGSALLPAVGDIVGGLFGGKKSNAPPAPPPVLPPPPVVVQPVAPPPPAFVRPLPLALEPDCPPCPVCPTCGRPDPDAMAPPSPLPPMPIPHGARLVRHRGGRRAHVRTR